MFAKWIKQKLAVPLLLFSQFLVNSALQGSNGGFAIFDSEIQSSFSKKNDN